MIETRSKACYFFELYENGAPDRERYGVLQKNTEYSKRKKSERSDKNSERSDSPGRFEAFQKNMERSKRNAAIKYAALHIKSVHTKVPYKVTINLVEYGVSA